ncbi:MAG: amino acid-binding protein [Verrucomicrobia bacterium]|nr:amino acid-binding protein [Verrucomicrobiota bacterium]
MIRQQFTLYLENRPGELAAVVSKLAVAGINIDGISVAESTDVAIVQMVVSSAIATKRVLAKAKIPYTTQNVALVHVKNRPGALAGILTKLSKRKININYIYSTACDCRNGCSSYAILSAPNLKKVEQAWVDVSV